MPPIQRLIPRDDLWLDRVPKLEEYFRGEAEKMGKKSRWKTVGGVKIPIFWPSSVSDCMRKITYDFLEGSSPTDVRGGMLMYDGYAHEESSLHWLGIMGYEITDSQKRLRKVFRKQKVPCFAVHGRPDGVIKGIVPADGGEPYDAVWEAKGLSTWTMKNKDPGNIVYDHYRDQVTLYMYMLKLKSTIFTMKDKNDSTLRFIEFLYSESRAKRLILKARKLAKLVTAKKLGPRAYESKTAKPCGWCRHKSKCWE